MNELETAKALFLEGLELLNRHEYASAELKLRAAHRLVPDRVSVVVNLTTALLRQDKIAESGEYAQMAVRLEANVPQVWLNLGTCQSRQRQFAEALASYEKALALNGDYAEAWLNRGATLHELAQYEAALASYDKALALNRDHAEAWLNRGVTLKQLHRFEDALTSLDRAIALNPQSAEGWMNRGVTLVFLKRYKEALAAHERAYSIRPDLPNLMGDLLLTRLFICRWDGFQTWCDEVQQALKRGDRACRPLASISLPLSAAQQRKCAELYVLENFPPAGNTAMPRRAHAGDRIRLGYFSADFYNHAVSVLSAGLFERHDRSRFETIAFSFGRGSNDEMRRRLQAAFDRFIDVRGFSDRDVVSMARDMDVEIAIDLTGFMNDSRTGIFAMRSAPIQVSYLGYPGTMGATYYDYLIADRTLIPEDQRCHYTERVCYLPYSYQPNDCSRRISDAVPTRNEMGLPEGAFVFCCFNNNFKITPDVFDVWMRLLRKVEGSVLWLIEDNPEATSSLRKEAELRNVSAARLVFAGRVAPADHLARHQLADLFLDTLYYNAHTTASDALWAGLPVLTRLGETFAGRVASSLLYAIGLPELVTRSIEEYEELAFSLARDPRRMAALRQKLAENRVKEPLFNTDLFTRHIEAAYTAMLERYRVGLAPEHLSVPA